MRILVTGGAGFIGSNLAKYLALDSDNRVIIVDDFSSGSFKNLIGFNGDIIACDVVSDQWWDRVGYVDVVFHQAAITDTTVMDQKRMMEVNVEGFRSVVNFAVKYDVRKVIYASSAAVYGNGECPMREDQTPTPQNIYGFSKAIMDNLARFFLEKYPKMRIIGLRYFNVYGPGESFKGRFASMVYQLYLQMKSGRKPRIFKYGEQMRDFVYVKDVVMANIRAMDCDVSGVYNVGTGKAENFNYLIECLNKACGTSYEPEYFDNPYDFYQNKTQADLRRAKAILNYRAEWDLENGVKDYVKLLEGK
ncbi:MAG: ADP-glyceromanno-heptose 6-epimerase [Elusimicrobiales bacterium]